jgi:hypothetical protein
MGKFGKESIESMQRATRQAAGSLKGDLTGEVLIVAMQASPHRDVDLEPRRGSMPVREVTF